MKKTEVICTMGPNTSDKSVMMGLTRNGIDMARFNFSHGDYNEHQGRLELLKEVREELNVPVAALFDIRGPEVRTGQLKNGKKVTLKEGQTYTLTTRELVGDGTVGYINHGRLNENVTAGSRILIDDGLVELEVREVKNMDIICEVTNGGELGEKKGINVPNVKIRLPALMDKGKEDIRFRVRQGFDFITASLVHTTDCIKEIKAILDKQGSDIKTIAKIENAEGIKNLDAIIETAGGIMVTGGDMDVEVPAEGVPRIQKRIICKCNEARKIVIIATQTLGSMIHNPGPTRAEVTDVVNTVYDDTDAMILSDETAMGRYPVDALGMMVSITLETERRLDYVGYRQRKVTEQNMENAPNAVCFASVSTAHDLDADVIIASSITDFTTQMPSEWRPGARIISMSPSMATVRQMQLQWDAVPVWSRRAEFTDELIENSVEELKDRGLVEEGELVVITVGIVIYTRRHKVAAQTSIMRVINIE